MKIILQNYYYKTLLKIAKLRYLSNQRVQKSINKIPSLQDLRIVAVIFYPYCVPTELKKQIKLFENAVRHEMWVT